MLSAPLYPLLPTISDVLNPKMAAKIERQQRSERRAPVRVCLLCERESVRSLTRCERFSSDGPGERRPTSTAWCPPLAWSLTPITAALTGPSSGPWRGCTRRPTRACRSTCVLSPPCADECVACRPKKEVGQSYTSPSHLHLRGARAVAGWENALDMKLFDFKSSTSIHTSVLITQTRLSV